MGSVKASLVQSQEDENEPLSLAMWMALSTLIRAALVGGLVYKNPIQVDSGQKGWGGNGTCNQLFEDDVFLEKEQRNGAGLEGGEQLEKNVD